MNRKLNNLRTLCAVMMAAAAFTACSSDDEPAAIQSDGPQTYTLTISAGAPSNATRALALTEGQGDDPAYLQCLWEEGDKVAVYKVEYSGTPWSARATRSITVIPHYTYVGTLTASSVLEGGTMCILTGTLTGTLAQGDRLEFSTPKGVFNYKGQKGTLADIAANYNYAFSEVQVYSFDAISPELTRVNVVGYNENEEEVPYAYFQNAQSVVRFTLVDKDHNNAPIQATSLTLQCGTAESTQGIGFILVTDPENEETERGDLVITPAAPVSSNVIWASVFPVFNFIEMELDPNLPLFGARRQAPSTYKPLIVLAKATDGQKYYYAQAAGFSFNPVGFHDILLEMTEYTPGVDEPTIQNPAPYPTVQ